MTDRADLIDLIRRHVDPDDETLARLTAEARPATLRRGTHLFAPPDVAKRLFVMTSGLVRGYYLGEDREVNLRLMCDGAAVLPLGSYLTGEPTYEYIQCLADSRGFWLELPRRDLGSDLDRAFDGILRVLVEQHFLALERRMLMLQQRGARARYAFFLERMEKKIVAETPAYHVASYLGITPEALSRIKHR